MRAVLHSAIDAEPITVVELNGYQWGLLRKHGSVRILMPDEPPAGWIDDETGLTAIPYPPVLTIHTVRLHGLLEGQLLLFADSDELALRLRPTFLPGQRQALRSRIGDRSW